MKRFCERTATRFVWSWWVDHHIALVEHAPFTEAPAEQESVEEGGTHCGSLAEFIAFADTVALDKLAFLCDAMIKNPIDLRPRDVG